MMQIQIVNTYTRCRFFVTVDGINLEPKLFCQLQAKRSARACTHFSAIPHPYADVMHALCQGVEQGLYLQGLSNLSPDSVKAIQAAVIKRYTAAVACHRCH